jgi:hypothetical protein
MYISVTKYIEIAYIINGIDGYGFGKDKKLYNLKRCKEVKQTLNNSTKGYWIGRKFYTFAKLSSLLVRPKSYGVPF